MSPADLYKNDNHNELYKSKPFPERERVRIMMQDI